MPERPAPPDPNNRWQQVKRAFEEAFAVPTEQRTTYIRDHCDDSEVEREVLELLAITDTRARQLEHLPVAPIAHDQDLAPGTRIDNYEIVERIGSGGMSTGVFKARDEHHDREVAIKILRQRQDPRRIEEQRVLGRLQHPNIASLYGSGITGDGLPYLAMEHVNGVPIDRHCFEQRLSVDDRLDLIARVCDGVDHAHRRLIVHRDLKPSNILVSADGMPKILDFGIAKVLDIDDLTLTRPEHRALSVPFASPEQLSGEEMQTNSDVYSLGVVLYHLLTGRLPFDVESPMALYTNTAREEPLTLRAIARQKRGFALDALSATDDDYFAGPFEIDLEGVLLKAIAIDPEERYATAAEFGDDLRAIIERRPVSARPASIAYRTSCFVRRNRTRLLAAGVALAVLGAASYWGVRASREADRARHQADVAQGHPCGLGRRGG